MGFLNSSMLIADVSTKFANISMSWIDWLIVIIPVAFVYYMGLRSRRYIRSVADFLSAGRLCGRYVINVGDIANALSIIGIVSTLEITLASVILQMNIPCVPRSTY